MTRWTKFACTAIAIAIAAPAIAQDSLDTTAVAALPATKSGKIGAPPTGKAQVVFFRPGSLVGAALGCTIYDSGKQIARLGSGKYWVHVAEPGKLLFNTKAENVDQLNMEVEPDETYFVKCNIGAGVMSGRPNISPSGVEEFTKKAKGLKLWEPKGEAAEQLAAGKAAQ